MVRRFVQRVVEFFAPHPTPEFRERMTESRRTAVLESRRAMNETRQRGREIDNMYDRIVLDKPVRNHREGDRRGME